MLTVSMLLIVTPGAAPPDGVVTLLKVRVTESVLPLTADATHANVESA
jgi:hypothetical protein